MNSTKINLYRISTLQKFSAGDVELSAHTTQKVAEALTFSILPNYVNSSYNFSLNNYSIQVVDFNGDGKSDLMHQAEPPYFRALITTPTDKASLKLSQITVGPNITTVDYGYLSGHANYTTSGTPVTSTAQQGVELPRKRTLTTMDGYGNATQVQEQTLNADGTASGYSRTTTNTYDSNAERARQGRLIRSTVTHVKP